MSFTLIPKQLSYFSVNHHLEQKHPNLSGYWTSMGFNDEKTESYVSYEMGDGSPDEVATVKLNGEVIASDRLLSEMNAIG